MSNQSNMLLNAVLNRLVPYIMRQGPYEAPHHAERTDVSYHVFRPVAPTSFESLEIEMLHCDGSVRLSWGDKQINISPDTTRGFVVFFNEGLREDTTAQEFATLDSMMDQAVLFAA